MASFLPTDIVLLICEELGNQRDFGTLFNCAISGKYFAGSALLWLYHIHHQTSIRGGEGDQNEMSRTGTFVETSFSARVAQQNRTVSKWALQWKSIIMSSLGKTAYPYCLYLRSMDLTNLEDLFEERVFRESISSNFFAGDMQIFLAANETPLKRRKSGRNVKKLFTPDIIELVGESLTKFVGDSATAHGGAAALEEISGKIPPGILPQWVGRLSKLKSMKLWDGSVLNATVAEAIRTNCPDFEMLNVYSCVGQNVDADLASFFSGMRPNSLRSLQVVSRNQIGGDTFLALGNHSKSLVELKLGGLPDSTIKLLSLLAACNALQTLHLEDEAGSTNLETTQHDIFLQIIAWLTSCKGLKSISLGSFVNGPTILKSVCLEDKIALESLTLRHYTLVNNQEFHRALIHQKSLESLELRADAEGSFRDDIDTLVVSLCTLTNLKELKILDTSDYFRDEQVQQLALSLSRLESLDVGGYELTDEIWPAVSNLRNLRILTFQAMTSFKFTGLLGYIGTLSEGNSGLLLSVMNSTSECDLTETERTVIRDALANKVDGKFEFVLYREPDSDYDSTDSD